MLDPAGTCCFDLFLDRAERESIACDPDSDGQVIRWKRAIDKQASSLPRLDPFEIEPEQREALKALGYGE